MEHRVEVVRILDVQPHPAADRLDVAKVYGFPVVCRRGEYAVGDLAAYVPIDSMVPLTEQWAWLTQGKEKHRRIEAKKIRGIFSMGLLVKPGELGVTGCVEGEDLPHRPGNHQDTPPPGGPPGPRARWPNPPPTFCDLIFWPS